MDLRQLRYFVAVAEAGHVTRAAAALGIQQPPLSAQIRGLESQLGLRLFRRHPKGVALTDGGRQLLDEARRVLAALAAAEQRMARVARGERGRLHVGCASSAGAHAFVPHLLRACRQRHPELELVLSEMNAAELGEALAASRLQVALLRVPVAVPEGVEVLTLLHEPAVLALPVDHPLAMVDRADARPVSLAALDGEPVILVRRPGAPGLYATLLERCAERGVHVRVVAEVERMMTNLNLVAAGVGLSVVPASMRDTHPQAIRYRPLSADARLDAPLTLMHRPDDADPATATFVALARTLAPSDGSAAARAPARAGAVRTRA
jgi:DNA-binding transcriptional LysR family regulator